MEHFLRRQGFNDERLKSFSDHQLDLARFRFVYGIPARSVPDLHRLLSWMRRHQFTSTDIKRARRWTAPSRNRPLNAPSWLCLGHLALVAILIAVAFVLILGKATDYSTTVIHMRVSKTWMWSDGKSVEGIWGQTWRNDAQSCNRHTLPATSLTGMTAAETTPLCHGIPSGDLLTTVNEGLRYQRWSLGAISIFLLLAGIRIGVILCFGIHARELVQRLSVAPSPSPPATDQDGTPAIEPRGSAITLHPRALVVWCLGKSPRCL